MVVPIRELLPHTHVLVGKVVGHDGAARTVELAADGGVTKTSPYDHLIVAPGSVSRTLPIPGLESAVGFKTLAEAIHLRNRVLRQLEIANVLEDPEERAAALTFVFVGGGYAGIESLAELEDLVRDAKPLYRSLTGDRARCVLVEAQEAVIPEVGGRLSAYAMRQLAQRDIEMRLGTTVVDASGGAVTLEERRAHPLPHPGLDRRRPPAPDDRPAGPADRRPRPDRRRRDHGGRRPARHLGPRRRGGGAGPGAPRPVQPAHLPARDPPGARGGVQRARGHRRPPAPALPVPTRGVFVDLGHLKAVASVFGLQFSGFPAWFLTRSYHLLQIPGRAPQGPRGGRLDRRSDLQARPGRAEQPRPARTAHLRGEAPSDVNALEAIRKRRTVRRYTDRPVADEDLDKLLRLALLAPTGGGRRPGA